MKLPSFFRRAAQARLFLTIGLAGIGLVILLFFVQAGFLVRMELKIYDALLPLRAAPQVSAVPVVVDLDEASLEEFGQWPWPRYRVADLILELKRYEVAAIGMDIIFSEPDNASPDEIKSYIKRDRGVELDFGGLPPELYNYDRLLAQTVKDAPVVLGAYARFDNSATESNLPVSVNIIERALPGSIPYKTRLNVATNAVLPLPILQDKAPLGLVNAAPDEDGLIRKTPLVIQVQDRLYPCLALRTLMSALNVKNLTIQSGPYGMEALKAGPYLVPVDSQGYMHVPFKGGRGMYPYISAKDILHRRVAPSALAGKIVFVGTSAAGLIDIRATPFDQVYPGVEVNAAVVDAILNNNSIKIPPWSGALQIMGILLAGIFSTLAFGFAGVRVYLPAAVLLIAVFLGSSCYFFLGGQFVSPFYQVLTVLLLAGILLFLRFWQEERQKLVLRNAFSRYVSPEVVKRVSSMNEDFFVGEEREVSIIFTDIRGFTTISEQLTPPQMVKLLNRYFTPMTALVRESSGTLDKFIGDALMAFWNAPLYTPNHPVQAVSAALSMQNKLITLREELFADFGVNIRIGAGIHTGTVYVGNMGSTDLINYTLIGDNVNITARLESLCGVYDVGVVVSGETKEMCGYSFGFQHLDTIIVKGKSQPVSVYAPMPKDEAAEREAELAAWEKALALYKAGDFDRAGEEFATLCLQYPEKSLYRMYAGRVADLKENPPEKWDAVWTRREK